MAVTFNTNVSALTAQRYLGAAGDAAASSLSKLSSGSRVPTAKDDAAGLAIGTKLKAEVAGLQQAGNNASQAISLLQIADGALSTTSDILQRMKSLAVQASSGQLSASDRGLLNQEFTNLRSEVDRIANITNFNGTTLLAGSTSVTGLTNSLAAYDATNGTSKANLLGSGFEDINFGNSFGNGAIKIEYNATGRVLTVKDLVNNKTQSVTLAAGAIGATAPETYSFGDIGVDITLNSNFDKAANIAGTNTSRVNVAAARIELTQSAPGLGVTTATYVSSINSYSFTGTGVNEFSIDQLYGATTTLSGVVATVSAGAITAGGRTFNVTSGTQSLAAAGNKDFTFSDGQGNSFVLRLVQTNAGTGSATGTITIDALANQSLAGKIESTGTGVNAPNISAITQGATAFNFGGVDNARLALDMTAAATTGASILLNGTTFSTGNAGGATADTTTTGVKTVTLTDGNGNGFSVQFNVTAGFTNGDAARIELGQFGQLAGAASATSGTTTFSFKVGTGTSGDDNIAFTLNASTTATLGISASIISGADGTNANTAITAINSAINTVASRRADVGAAQSRLQFAGDSIAVAIENTTSAQSALLDVDVSAEITTFTSKQVLLQAGVSLLAQANQQPSLLLRLLQ